MEEEIEVLEQEMQEQQPEKTFTQAELDKIVAERLARAKKPDDYDDLKELLGELEEYGYPQSPKEAKEMIRAAKEQAKAERELAELEEQARVEGTSPELLKEIKELKGQVKELSEEKEAIKAAKQAELDRIKAEEEADAAWQTQVDEITEAHPDIDLETLNENTKFIKFIKGKSGMTLKELYEDFIEFIGETESAAIKKAMSKAERSTGNGKGNSGKASILTDEQKKTLSDWNRKNPPGLQMSEKEFLESMNR